MRGHERTRRLPVGPPLYRGVRLAPTEVCICLRVDRGRAALSAEPKYPDAYVSDDADTAAVRELLKCGFRWVCTEGELAIFEKEGPR